MRWLKWRLCHHWLMAALPPGTDVNQTISGGLLWAGFANAWSFNRCLKRAQSSLAAVQRKARIRDGLNVGLQLHSLDGSLLRYGSAFRPFEKLAVARVLFRKCARQSLVAIKNGTSGNAYFVGRFGQPRIVILRDFDQPEGDNQDETYTMWIEDPDRAKKAAQAKGAKA